MKRCSKCRVEKDEQMFGKRGGKRTDLRSACKECLGGERRVWRGMRERCLNPKLKGYPNYGGKGIQVCERWMTFENFLADMGRRPSSKYTLERINNNGNYEPTNCRWATMTEQQRNRSSNRLLTYQSKTQPAVVWAEEVGVEYQTLMKRLEAGWDVGRALSVPSKRQRRFSASEDRTLCEAAGVKSTKEIAAQLNRSLGVVYNRAAYLGISLLIEA